ncbi:MAG: hypothetical protein F4110_00995 [Acidimicrobiaceae bacterium]|nr:hypothetical protein [Acidimicrobiaceae bacterium]MXZ98795.1 hypothetical protein [Acidimicrobiaceae bacterium]MYE76642.1 hypothetical protein [Acidimicrobiaceae bacterium]MYE96601.1 hypothetical protein [Acidimicrobiaceae bacterium]MYH43944.1 hypothetical protein [Acidimicrobiaceae bacterium]
MKSEQSAESTAAAPQPLSEDELEQAHGGNDSPFGAPPDSGGRIEPSTQELQSQIVNSPGAQNYLNNPYAGVDSDTIEAAIAARGGGTGNTAAAPA